MVYKSGGFCSNSAPYTEPRRPTPKKEIKSHCTQCGKELKPDFRFCPDCGTGIKNISRVLDPHKVCASCKIPFEDQDKFCGGCGKKRP